MKNLKINIYCIKDDLEGFMTPWCMTSNDSARRQFSDVINREGTTFNNHPEQFNLYKLGILDTETGTIDSSVEHIDNGAKFKE